MKWSAAGSPELRLRDALRAQPHERSGSAESSLSAVLRLIRFMPCDDW